MVTRFYFSFEHEPDSPEKKYPSVEVPESCVWAKIVDAIFQNYADTLKAVDKSTSVLTYINELDNKYANYEWKYGCGSEERTNNVLRYRKPDAKGMIVWTNKIGGDASSLLSIDLLDGQGVIKVKDIDDVRTAIVNSSVRIKAPECFGMGAVDIFSQNGELLDPVEPIFDGKVLKYTALSFSEPELASATGSPPFIHVPGDIEYSKGVLDCRRFATPHQACSHESLIGLETTLANAVRAVDRELPNDDRVPPLVFTRMARGGKTTFLCELFDRLRSDDKAVTLISLRNLPRRADESGRDTLLRLIALQLLPDMPFNEAVHVRVNEDSLFEVIDATRGEKPWVLLIDDMNNLGVHADSFVADLLRRILDHIGYYVVCTSRVPLTGSLVEAGLANKYSVPVSDRAVRTVPLPICTDASILSGMFSKCEPLVHVTPSEVAMYLGMPSLIYAIKRCDAESPVLYFARQCIFVERVKAVEVLQSFIYEVLSGKQVAHGLSTRFYRFGQMPQEMRIQWPICYIACILDMPAFNLHLDVQGTVNRLATHAEQNDSGLDWAMVVQVAILLQCLYAKMLKGSGPFNIVNYDQCQCVVTREFPVGVITVEAANSYIENELAACEPGTILVATPQYTRFRDYDVIVAFKRQNGTVRKVGVHCKLGRTYPKREVLEAAYLVRGWAPTANNLNGKWKYCSEEAVEALVGSSLAPLIPKTWPAVPAVDAYD